MERESEAGWPRLHMVAGGDLPAPAVAFPRRHPRPCAARCCRVRFSTVKIRNFISHMGTYKTLRKDNKKKICSVRVGRFHGEEPTRNFMVRLTCRRGSFHEDFHSQKSTYQLPIFPCRTHPTRIRECRICHKTISSWTDLRAHLATHSAESGLGFQCSECPKRFKYSHSLAKHSDTHLVSYSTLSGSGFLSSSTFIHLLIHECLLFLWFYDQQ